MKISIVIDEIEAGNPGESLRKMLHAMADAFADYSGEKRYVVPVADAGIAGRAVLDAAA